MLVSISNREAEKMTPLKKKRSKPAKAKRTSTLIESGGLGEFYSHRAKKRQRTLDQNRKKR